MTESVHNPLSAVAAPAGSGKASRRFVRMWSQGSSPTTQVIVLAGRSLRSLRDPKTILVGLLQPMVMLLLISQVFAEVAGGDRNGYLNFLMPAVLVTTAAGSALGSGGWLVFERNSGVFTRLRAMPIRISSILIARSISDLVRTGVQMLCMLFFAMLLLGYRPDGGVMSLFAAWSLSMIVGCGFSWTFLAVSCWIRNVEVIQGIGFIVMFPLTFASTAYVPLNQLPPVLQAIAVVNPISYAVNGARSVTSSDPSFGLVMGALVVSLLFTAIGMHFALRGFRRSL